VTARSIPTATALVAITALAEVLREVGGGVVYATVQARGKGRLVVMTGLDPLGQVEFVRAGDAWVLVEAVANG
jgi:hypothetical protein